jgi:ribosomal protein S18 acetylase RimI-like enzyme
VVEPPTPTELEAIRRHLVALPGQEGAEVREDEQLGVTFVRGPGSGPDLTYAALPRWDASTWPEALRAVRRHMLDQRSWPSLLLTDGPGQPQELSAELVRQGWTAVLSENVMWVGHASTVPHLDPSMRIEAVQPRTLAAHEQLERAVFGLGADQVEQRRAAIAAALADGRIRAWVVWLDQVPVAVARLSQGEGVAALQGIGVAEPYRGHGYGTLVTTVATRAGLATGNRLVWLSVRDDNQIAVRLYERLGFARAFSWTRWLLTEDPRPR